MTKRRSRGTGNSKKRHIRTPTEEDEASRLKRKVDVKPSQMDDVSKEPDRQIQLNERQKMFLKNCEFKSCRQDIATSDCTETHCNAISEDTKTISCSKCRRTIHWKCTRLPPYQLQQFVAQNKEINTFVCVNCIEVQEELCSEMTQDGTDLMKVVEEQAKLITMLQKQLRDLSNSEESVQRNKTKKRVRIDSSEPTMIDAMIADSSDKDIKISVLEEEATKKDMKIDQLRKEKSLIELKLKEKQISTKEYQKVSDSNASNLQTVMAEEIKSIKGMFENRLCEMEQSITKNFEHKIDALKQQTESYASKVGGTSANISKPEVMNFREIMMNTRNEELAEERDKKLRSKNIIIHGRNEAKGQDEDNIFVNELMKKLQLEHLSVKSVQRIAKSGNSGPIKCEFETDLDKMKVLQSLRKLKGDSAYKGIGITEDYTLSERKLIQEYNARAKERNEAEGDNNDFVWRVRGSPKNGLFLKKLRKSHEEAKNLE